MSYIGARAPDMSTGLILGDPSSLSLVQYLSQDFLPKDGLAEDALAFDQVKGKCGRVQALGFVKGKEGERCTMVCKGLRKSRRHFAMKKDVLAVPQQNWFKKKKDDNSWIQILTMSVKDKMLWLKVAPVLKEQTATTEQTPATVQTPATAEETAATEQTPATAEESAESGEDSGTEETEHTPADVINMEPRVILASRDLIDVFITHTCEHLPDVSERPDIPVAKVWFWMMEDDRTPKRKRKHPRRYPKPHSVMKGLSGKRFNNAIDNTIQLNKWCAKFRDDAGGMVNLVDMCIVACWLHYIAHMVSLCFVSTSIRFALYTYFISPLHHIQFALYECFISPLRHIEFALYECFISPLRHIIFALYKCFISPLRHIIFSLYVMFYLPSTCRTVTPCLRVMRVN